MVSDCAAFWFTSASVMTAELVAARQFGRAIVDLEHGAFDQESLNIFIPFCRSLQLKVFAKVAGPRAEAIHLALDYGCDGVIIPHIQGVEHARLVCAHASYPPRGTRSSGGGRTTGYRLKPKGFFESENRRVLCLPMVESAAALNDVERILELDTVSGVFAGPTDLALSRGRTGYFFDHDDQADLVRIAAAARAAGKPWIMPAWTASERRFATAHGVAWMAVLDEEGALTHGMDALLSSLTADAQAA